LEASTTIAGGGEIRFDRVAELRHQISRGTYETPSKLDAAIDRLIEHFA
jgi:anti-sigma28 factor (negative regulator of flagellin synthesis)